VCSVSWNVDRLEADFVVYFLSLPNISCEFHAVIKDTVSVGVEINWFNCYDKIMVR